jgi:hypothetical protein
MRLPSASLSPRRASARGLSLIGLVFWAVVISFAALITLRVLPTVNEYLTIDKAVDKVAHAGGSSVPELRAAFDRVKQIEYSISSISGKDLEITKNNDRIVIGFAYDKEIELFGPVYLLIKYRGQSK